MKRERFTLPTYCGCCGAYLMGGATVHKPHCEFQKLIEDSAKLPVGTARKPNADEQEGDWSGDKDYEPNE